MDPNNQVVVKRIQERGYLLYGFLGGAVLAWLFAGAGGQYSPWVFIIGLIAYVWWTSKKQQPDTKGFADAVRAAVAELGRLGFNVDYDVRNIDAWSPPGTTDLWWIDFCNDSFCVLVGRKGQRFFIYDKTPASLSSIKSAWGLREYDLARSKATLEEVIASA